MRALQLTGEELQADARGAQLLGQESYLDPDTGVRTRAIPSLRFLAALRALNPHRACPNRSGIIDPPLSRHQPSAPGNCP
ncbi:hypothetical protein [Nonomuraea sp. NPDC004354]